MRRAVCLCLVAFLVSSSAPFIVSQKRASAGLDKSFSAGSTQPAAVVRGESTRFAGARAFTDGFRVWIAWQMEAEVSNIGFHVYRSGRKGQVLLNPVKLVRGSAMHSRVPVFGETYSFFDPTGGVSASYYIEAVSLNGNNVGSGQIFPTYVSDLQAASGLSFDDMALHAPGALQSLEAATPAYTKDIRSEMEQARPLDNPTVHRTVISQPGVRIGVKKDGLYRVTRAQLEAAGFDVNSDSSLWQLYVEGVEQAIIVGANASYIEFYGTAIDTQILPDSRFSTRQKDGSAHGPFEYGRCGDPYLLSDLRKEGAAVLRRDHFQR
jgi:hypothetical protein